MIPSTNHPFASYLTRWQSALNHYFSDTEHYDLYAGTRHTVQIYDSFNEVLLCGISHFTSPENKISLFCANGDRLPVHLKEKEYPNDYKTFYELFQKGCIIADQRHSR